MQIIHSHTEQGERDEYMLLEAGELPAVVDEHSSYLKSKINSAIGWTGDTFEGFAAKVRLGDTKFVEVSEKHLAEVEDQVPVSRGWRNVDDVVGAVPNVPAFLAGHPQHMRRRERTMKQSAPLTIFMDLTSSGGIEEYRVSARGCVLLALLRMLVDHRPVELYVGAALGHSGHYNSLGSRGMSATVAWRIDTAPLDLARAAYHISATAMSRGFGYGMCQHEFKSSGAWPLGDYDRHCRTAPQRLQAVFPGTEIMYVPPIMLYDPMTKDPVGWIKRVLAEYLGGDDDE